MFLRHRHQSQTAGPIMILHNAILCMSMQRTVSRFPEKLSETEKMKIRM